MGSGPRSTLPGHLPEERATLAQRSREHWEERADAIAPSVRAYIRRVFEPYDFGNFAKTWGSPSPTEADRVSPLSRERPFSLGLQPFGALGAS